MLVVVGSVWRSGTLWSYPWWWWRLVSGTVVHCSHGHGGGGGGSDWYSGTL